MAAPREPAWLYLQRRLASLSTFTELFESSTAAPGFDYIRAYWDNIIVIRAYCKPQYAIATYDNNPVLYSRSFSVRMPTIAAPQTTIDRYFVRVGLLRKNDQRDIDPVYDNVSLVCESRRLYYDSSSGHFVPHPDQEFVALADLKPAAEEPAKPLNWSKLWGSAGHAYYWLQVLRVPIEVTDVNSLPFYDSGVVIFIGFRHGRATAPPKTSRRKGEKRKKPDSPSTPEEAAATLAFLEKEIKKAEAQ